MRNNRLAPAFVDPIQAVDYLSTINKPVKAPDLPQVIRSFKEFVNTFGKRNDHPIILPVQQIKIRDEFMAQQTYMHHNVNPPGGKNVPFVNSTTFKISKNRNTQPVTVNHPLFQHCVRSPYSRGPGEDDSWLARAGELQLPGNWDAYLFENGSIMTGRGGVDPCAACASVEIWNSLGIEKAMGGGSRIAVVEGLRYKGPYGGVDPDKVGPAAVGESVPVKFDISSSITLKKQDPGCHRDIKGTRFLFPPGRPSPTTPLNSTPLPPNFEDVSLAIRYAVSCPNGGPGLIMCLVGPELQYDVGVDDWSTTVRIPTFVPFTVLSVHPSDMGFWRLRASDRDEEGHVPDWARSSVTILTHDGRIVRI